jgi:hypothetical protein
MWGMSLVVMSVMMKRSMIEVVCTLCADSALAFPGRQVGGIFTGTWRASKGSLILVQASVADTAGFAGSISKHGVARKHTEPL